MKKRWICLYVENEIGVLARISGLFSSKLYNLNSLTVGETEDPTISRMTISLTSDDQTFEQVKKQLNQCVEVIRVVDYTDMPLHMKEIMFAKILKCNEKDRKEAFRMAEVFKVDIVDYDTESILMQCVQSESYNNSLIELLEKTFKGRVEIVRGGSVAVEAISVSKR